MSERPHAQQTFDGGSTSLALPNIDEFSKLLKPYGVRVASRSFQIVPKVPDYQARLPEGQIHAGNIELTLKCHVVTGMPQDMRNEDYLTKHGREAYEAWCKSIEASNATMYKLLDVPEWSLLSNEGRDEWRSIALANLIRERDQYKREYEAAQAKLTDELWRN